MPLLPLPLFAAVAVEAPANLAAPTVEDDRLRLCVEQAAHDAPGALVTASQWAREARGIGRSKPQQCLGMIYSYLLKWDQAENAFTLAIAYADPSDAQRIARLRAQAGNAALTAGKADRALNSFALAQPLLAGEELGQLQIDRARALVALGRTADAATALAEARALAPQEPVAFLLSATLARRDKDIVSAQQMIVVAISLAPRDPDVLLEAGVIAMLAGKPEAARDAWEQLLRATPTGDQADTARGYLAQLGPRPPANPTKEAPGR